MARPVPYTDDGGRVGRHPANTVALIFGLVFCGIAGGWLLLQTGVLVTSDLQWAVPALFIGAGLAGVGVSLGKARRSRRGS